MNARRYISVFLLLTGIQSLVGQTGNNLKHDMEKSKIDVVAPIENKNTSRFGLYKGKDNPTNNRHSLSMSSYWSRDNDNGFLYPSQLTDRIGIGTSDPKCILDVQSDDMSVGGIRWWGRYNGAYSVLYRNNARGMLILGSSQEVEVGDNKLLSQLILCHTTGGWQTNTNNENYNLNPRHGNVGIGYVDPEFKLDVSGSSFSRDAGTTHLEVKGHYTGEEDAVFTVQIATTDPLQFEWNKDEEDFSSPTAIVFMREEVLSDGVKIKFHEPKSGDEFIENQTWTISAKVNDPFAVRNYKGKKALVANKYGKIGIGLSTPKAALHIYRNLYFRSSADNPLVAFAKENMIRVESKLPGIFPKPHCVLDVWSGPKVGIGVYDPKYILQVKEGGGPCVSDRWEVYSSKRLKTNIEPIESAIEKVKKLRGVAFTWKRSGEKDIGVLAEEVGAICPEVVTYEANGVDAVSVDYSRLIVLLIESVKEQQKELEAQRKMIMRLTEGRE